MLLNADDGCDRPEKIEAVYQRSKFVQQIFVHGDSLQSALVAIVVPQPEVGVAPHRGTR
jgi:hypothetical protein